MVHTSPVVLNQEIELQIIDWVHGQKNHGFFVYTHNIIAKVLQINLEFKVGCVNSTCWWIYRFLRRNKLALRRLPRVSQQSPAQAEAICESFAQSSTSHILMNDIPRSLLNQYRQDSNLFYALYITTVNGQRAKTFQSAVEAVPARMHALHQFCFWWGEVPSICYFWGSKKWLCCKEFK